MLIGLWVNRLHQPISPLAYQSISPWLCAIVALIGFVIIQPLSQADPLEEAKLGIVHVITEKEGSGIIAHINEDQTGYIVTNYHVIKPSIIDADDETEVIIPIEISGKSIGARVKNYDPDDTGLDLALLLTIDALPPDANRLSFAREEEVIKATNTHCWVRACGYPGWSKHNCFDGQINSSSGRYLIFTLDHNTEIKGGLSGSPLMDKDGLVLGVNTRSISGSNYAVRSDTVRSILLGWGVNLLPPSTPDGKVGVWFAQIENDDNNNMTRKNLIDKVNYERGKDSFLVCNVDVKPLDQIISTHDVDYTQSHDHACYLGKCLNAAIVVWGAKSSSNIGTTLSPQLSFVKGKGRQLQEILFSPEKVEPPKVVDESEFKRIAIFIIGYCYYVLEEYDKAYSFFKILLDEHENGRLDDSPFIGDLHLFAGLTKWNIGMQKDRKANLKKAIEHYEKAQRYYIDELQLAHTENDMGIAYKYLPRSWYQYPPVSWILFWTKGNRQKAIERIEKAGVIYKKKKRDYEYAATQNNLVLPYINSGKYTEAIKAGETALEIYKANLLFSVKPEYQAELDKGEVSKSLRQEFLKSKYIQLSQNLAIVPIKEESDEWIITDKGSRKVYSIKKEGDKLNVYEYPHPAEYATVKHNMGIASFRKKDINDAIKAYRYSLGIRIKDLYPVRYARVQYNLGRAYEALPGGDNLTKACEAYKEALSIYEERLNENKTYERQLKNVKRRLEVCKKPKD